MSFLVWCLLMVGVLCFMGWSARRSRKVTAKVEETASDTLPKIGAIAEKKHQEKFGRGATSTERESRDSWYPPPGKKS